MTSCEFWNGFLKPPRICSQSPFWFLNDRVDGEVYEAQVRAMAEKGVRQVMPHPRYGMDRREYLTERYMEAFARLVETADELGMGVNLYDDFNWSSGQCGGRITADRAMCAMGIAMQRRHVQGGRVSFSDPCGDFCGWARLDGVLLCGYAPYVSDSTIDFSGMTAADRPAFEADGTVSFDLPEGDWWAYAVYSLRTVHESPLREGNGGIIDYLGEEPVRRFIALTHERYYARLGRYFGTTIQSIFSDEVGPYACGEFTWTADFADCFRQYKGYDLLTVLPMLWFDGSPLCRKVRADYWDTVSELYVRRFVDPIADWCRAHGIASTGHTFEESFIWPISGDMYRILRHQMWVGVDSLLGYKPYSAIKPAISAAHVTGRREVLCEAIGLLGEEIGPYGSWTCAPRQAKYAYQQLAVAGVSLIVPHAFFQSTDNPKAECPPSFFKDNHYWRYYNDMARFTDIMCYVNRETTPVCDAAVLYPMVSWWAGSREGRGRGSPTHFPRDGRAYHGELTPYDALLESLMRHHIDYDVLDLEALTEASVENGCLMLHGICWRVLVLPPITTERRDTLRRLAELARQGVPMIALEGFNPTASMDQGEHDAVFAELAAQLKPYLTVCADPEALDEAIRARIPADVTVIEGDRDAFDSAHRVVDNTDIYLLFNLRDKETALRLRLRTHRTDFMLLSSMGQPIGGALVTPEGGATFLDVTLPNEELCYAVFSDERIPLGRPAADAGTVLSPQTWLFTPAPQFSGEFPYGRLPLQALTVPVGRTWMYPEGVGDPTLLTRWMQVDFDDSAWDIVTLKRRGALYDHKNSQFFRFVIPAGSIALKMPLPSDCEYALYINGEPVVAKLDKQGEEACWLPIEGCEEKPGVLAIETASMRPGFGLLSGPCFLIKPYRTRARDWRELGIEWYSGFGVYETVCEHSVFDAAPIVLDLGEVRECCEVWVNDVRIGQAMWPPYRFDLTHALLPGRNRIRVAVCNLMSNEYTWDVIGSRGTGRCLPSGLISKQ